MRKTSDVLLTGLDVGTSNKTGLIEIDANKFALRKRTKFTPTFRIISNLKVLYLMNEKEFVKSGTRTIDNKAFVDRIRVSFV